MRGGGGRLASEMERVEEEGHGRRGEMVERDERRGEEE